MEINNENIDAEIDKAIAKMESQLEMMKQLKALKKQIDEE